jgi:hypothetical protein
MPIIGATQLEPIAPVTNYLTGLQTARNAMLQQQEMAMAQRKFQREEETAAAAARRAAQVNALIEQKRQEGVAPSPEDFVRIGAFEEAKSLADVGTSITEGKSKSVDLVDKAMALSRQALDNVSTPEEMMAWHEANHSDPVLGPYLAQRGITAEQSRQKIMEASRDPATFQQLILDSRLGLEKSREQNFVSQNLGGSTRVLSMSKYGGPATVVPGSEALMTPKPAAVQAQAVQEAAAGASRPSPVESKYQMTLAEIAAKEDAEAYNAARRAAEDLSRDYEIESLLNEGEPITGYMAEVGLEYNRIKAKIAGDKQAANKVQSTELLNALLGQEVFSTLSLLGLASRNIDTPAERDYLREVIAGTIPLNDDTLREMARIRVNVKERAVDRFNERIQRGEMNSYFQATNREKRPIEKPERPTRRAAPTSSASSKATRVNSPDELAKLPSGALYIGPDNKERRKP